MEILRYLQRPPFIFSVPELAKALKIPITTLIFHLDKMAAAEIVTVAYKSTKRGAVRLVQRRMKSLGIELINLTTGYASGHHRALAMGIDKKSPPLL